MGMHMRCTAALISAALLGLTGCQSFPWMPPSSSTSNSPSSTGPSASSFLPSMVQGPLDGSGATTSMELPKQKKIDVCLAAGQQMEKSGKLGEAIFYFESVRQLDSRRDLFCAKHLAILYDRKGDFDKALDEYNKLIAANPKDAEAHNDLGYGYYTRGKFEAAEKSLLKAVALDPKSKRAWANLGMAQAQIGKYEESLASFEKSVNKAQGLCNIGFIQAAQGKWIEARDSYAMALKIEPGLQKAHAALQHMDEGPKSKKDRMRQDARSRGRELERGPAVDPALARGLPVSDATGAIGADSNMIQSLNQPVYLPMPADFTSPRGTNTPLPPPNSFAPPPSIPLPQTAASPSLPTAPNPNLLSID